MTQQMPVAEVSEDLYSRDSWSTPAFLVGTERRSFDFRKMFAAIALDIGSSAVKRGFFCDVAMDVKVPRYLRGYPDLLQKLICTLAEHSLAHMRNGGLVLRVEAPPIKKGGVHLVRMEICDSSNGFLEHCPDLGNILERFSYPSPSLSRDKPSSWVFLERMLKSPLNGRIVMQSLYDWGSRCLIEIELEAGEGLVFLPGRSNGLGN